MVKVMFIVQVGGQVECFSQGDGISYLGDGSLPIVAIGVRGTSIGAIQV